MQVVGYLKASPDLILGLLVLAVVHGDCPSEAAAPLQTDGHCVLLIHP